MVKAWERRFGARVELDVKKQSASLSLPGRRVDVAQVAKAAEEAGFTVTKMAIDISSVVEQELCARCSEQRRFVKTDSSRLELRGEDLPPAGKRARIQGPVNGWATEHPTVDVSSR